ncbi:MAG TPA: hypothetical protein PK093_24140 [Phycisphaerae bacterium]|nr:hypothetical protein [Phycisphaerae bacterium]
MGLFDFLKKRQPSPPDESLVRASAPIAPPSPHGTTRIEREHFLLHAPFEWTAVPPTKDLEYEFRNQTLPEQLIVTVILPGEPLDATKRRLVVHDLTNARLRAVSQLSSGQAEHSTPRSNEGTGQYEMRCVGVDKLNGVRFAFVVRAASDRVVTVALTRYTLVELGAPFDVYVEPIFDLLQFRSQGQREGT